MLSNRDEVIHRKKAFVEALNRLAEEFKMNYIVVVDASDVEQIEPMTAFRHNMGGADHDVLRWAGTHILDTADYVEDGGKDSPPIAKA